MILSISMNRVRFSYIVGVRCDVLVPSVAPRDLIFVVVPQTVADLNTRCSIKSILERIADDAKVWQSHPARFDRTGSRHPMAFAFLAHLSLNVLQSERIARNYSSSCSNYKSQVALELLIFSRPTALKLEIEISRAIKFTSRACQVAEWVVSPQVAHHG